jgi:hypothetical protein
VAHGVVPWLAVRAAPQTRAKRAGAILGTRNLTFEKDARAVYPNGRGAHTHQPTNKQTNDQPRSAQRLRWHYDFFCRISLREIYWLFIY